MRVSLSLNVHLSNSIQNFYFNPFLVSVIFYYFHFFILESLLKIIGTYIAKRPVTSPRPQGRKHNVTVDASVRHSPGALLCTPGLPR